VIAAIWRAAVLSNMLAWIPSCCWCVTRRRAKMFASQSGKGFAAWLPPLGMPVVLDFAFKTSTHMHLQCGEALAAWLPLVGVPLS